MVFVADVVKALRCERSHVGSIPTDHPIVRCRLNKVVCTLQVTSRMFRRR